MINNISNHNAPSDRPSHRSSDTGSALLIVIGTLALIAVFAAIYISIGQGDQRVARAITNKVEVNEFRDVVADHALSVLRNDRLDFTLQHSGTDTAVFAIAEATDAPYTDWTMRSESSNLWERFNPSGRHSLIGPAAISDYRVASDPWLASTTPTYLGDPGQPANNNDLRPFGSLLTVGYEGDPSVFIGNVYSSGFLDNRDWLQISNLAPDGRFVNLFNLRNSTAQANGFSDATFGGFESEPGTGTTTRVSDNRSIRRMSNYLSLWNQEMPGLSSSRIKSFDPVAAGVWLPGRNAPDSNHGLTDLPNTPAVWTMYQRFAFLPLNQPFLTVNRNNQVSTWADPDFPAYQWADADGDGMADSRWFELSSAQELNSANTTPRDDVERLYDAGQFRLFAAARVVDLSSMVNVNTATEQLVKPEPTMGAPMGATPADVDLRRLLTMQDASENYSLSPLGNGGLSPSQYHRPRGARNNPMNNLPEQTRDDDYFFYHNYTFDDPTTPEVAPVVLPYSTSLSIGRYAYTAIKRGMIDGDTLDDRYYAWPPEYKSNFGASPPAAMPMSTDFDDVFNAPTPSTTPSFYDPMSSYRLSQKLFEDETTAAEDRKEFYETYGNIDPTRDDIQNQTSELSALYNNDDLLELLTFHGLNDPATLSRLEKAAMGRMPSIYQQNQRAFTPLLSNRSLQLDRYQHGYVNENGYTNSYPVLDPRAKREVTGNIAKESMALFATSPRRLMTTISGATPMKSGQLTDPNAPTFIGLDATPLSSALSDANVLFDMYSSALVGELNATKLSVPIDAAFVTDITTRRSDPMGAPIATLFYGHRGPELALRASAHMAANMKDMTDGDTEPTIVTLLMDNSRRDEFENTSNFPDTPEDIDPANQWYQDFPGVAEGNIFDMGESNLPGVEGSTAHLPVHRRAVNIYGIEPTPIITETVSFYVYTDAAEGANGDTDSTTLRPRRTATSPPAVPIPGTQPNITIVGTPNPVSNPDCLMHAIAFQLHNPWDAPISLGGDKIVNGPSLSRGSPLTRHRDPDNTDTIEPNSNYQFEYYIEWNGYFFKLAEYAQYYPPSSSQFDLRSFDEDDLGVNNPAIDFPEGVINDPNNGTRLDPATYPDYVGRNVVLNPGETRVFYAIADSRFNPGQSESELDQKWRQALSEYGDLPLNYTDLTGYDIDGDSIADGNDGRGGTGAAAQLMFKQIIYTRAPPPHTTTKQPVGFLGVAPAARPRGAGSTRPAADWMYTQFISTGARPIQIHPMNPETGEYADAISYYDYLNTAQDPASPVGLTGQFDQLIGTNRQSSTEVRLWRKITTPAEESIDTVNFNHATTQNLLHNDMLVDRMKIDAVAQPIDLTDNKLPQSAAFPENYPDLGNPAEVAALVRNDNTGYTVVKWASASRRDWIDNTPDDISIPSEPGIGQVREWMLASRKDPSSGLVFATDSLFIFDDPTAMDAGSTDPASPAEFTNADFIKDPAEYLDNVFNPVGQIMNGDTPSRGDYEAHRTLRSFLQSNSPLVTAGLEPSKKSELNFLAPANGEFLSADKYNRDGVNAQWPHPSVTLHEEGDTSPDNLRPELITFANFHSAPRLADLLLPWGIGPTFAPTSAGSLSTTQAEYYPEEWMTLTEALSIALGYEDPDPAAIAADDIWAGTFAPDDNFFDNGHLVLDNYVAYYNTDTSENPPNFDTAIDIRRGTGIPMALGILDQASALVPRASTSGEPPNATLGLININTAPVEVLRLLPGLTPPLSSYYEENTTAPATEEWWANADDTLELPNLSKPFDLTFGPTPSSPEDRTPDVAAMLVAYRDRIQADPRAASRTNVVSNEGNPLRYTSAPVSSDKHAANLITEQTASDLMQTTDHRDRATIAGVDALRPTPGFGSLGEVLMATISPDAMGAGLGNGPGAMPSALSTYYKQLDIQQYGTDTLNLDGGPDNAKIALDPQLFGGSENGLTPDDYAERLAMADGILNTISVRSDYFAVWFVIHAYQESDVANLKPEDPLIPSLAKRYVMVVDRSNVKDSGDTPRIVLLREVPM